MQKPAGIESDYGKKIMVGRGTGGDRARMVFHMPMSRMKRVPEM